MDADHAKLFAGQMGICAVVLNVLIDKGVITGTSFVRDLSKPKMPRQTAQADRSQRKP